jgi:hypothetical protein
MTCIALETIRRRKNEFELRQTWYTGFMITGEKVHDWVDAENDRLRAAIINVGYACRDLYEARHLEVVRIISIESDQDGKDNRYAGEHNILFNLLFPHNDYEAAKSRSLYADYLKYLTRINELRHKAKIEIKMHRLGALHPYAEFS